MGEAQCDQCGGTGWYLTPPLECRDGKMRRTRCKCGCGKAGLTDLARENADLRARLAAAEKARDEQAEAVRVLAEGAYVMWTSNNFVRIANAHTLILSNPIAAAAVKEAGQ